MTKRGSPFGPRWSRREEGLEGTHPDRAWELMSDAVLDNHWSSHRGRNILRRDRMALAGLITLGILGIAALAGPGILTGDPSRIDLNSTSLPPSLNHYLGTDLLGRDILRRALYGGRISLAIGLCSAAVAAVLGMVLGLIAAYRGGLVDALVTRTVDAALAMPALFVLVALQASLGRGVASVVVMVSLVGWMVVARVVRALTLSLKERDYVHAARALGCSESRILFRHIAPNLAGQAVVLYALGVADALLMESALSFLGMGVPADQPSWGNMLSDAQAAILSGAWWVAAFPGTVILVTALAINLVGDGLQETLNPDV